MLFDAYRAYCPGKIYMYIKLFIISSIYVVWYLWPTLNKNILSKRQIVKYSL